MKIAAAVAVLALAAGGLAAFAASGPDPRAVPTVQQVAHRTMSPFCPGLNLEECPSGQAAQLRAKIARRVAEKQTNAQIDDWLLSEYGRSVAGRPKSAVSWAVPLGATAAGLGVLVVVMASRKPPEAEAPTANISEQERAELDEDLGRFAARAE
ncbi:MAG: cytochrome c-type biogenesis protein [Actinomycetota bacterium]